MNKFFIIFIILILYQPIASAQINKDGLPLVQIYTTDEYEAHGQNWAIVKDKKGIMYFANNFGLLQYNGVKWNLFENPHSPYIRSLCVDANGTVYYGAASDFGMIMPDSIGGLKYYSISKASEIDPNSFNNVWNAHIAGNSVYFQAYEGIFKYKLPVDTLNPESLKTGMKVFKPENYFHWSFVVNNKFYVREAGKGLLVDQNDSLVFIKGSEVFANQKIYVMLPYKGTSILLVTRESGVYIYEPENKTNPFSLTEFPVNQLLINSYIYGGEYLENDKYAVYTLANGIVIFDGQGNIINHYGKQNCLPGSTILSAFYDRENGIFWFATDKEIGNLNLGSPFRRWTQTTGVQGTVTDIVRMNNTIYLSDNTGVYYLGEADDGTAYFHKIKGVDIPVTDLEIFQKDGDNVLLAGGDGGVFVIDGHSANQIDNSGIVLRLKQSKLYPDKVYIGYVNGFAYAYYDLATWRLQDKNPYFQNSIIDIFESEQSGIYLGTETSGVLNLNDPTDSIVLIDGSKGLPLEGSMFKVFNIENDIVVAYFKGLYKIDEIGYHAQPYNKLGNEFTNGNYGIFNISRDGENFWLGAYSNDLRKSKWQGIIKLVRSDDGTFKKETGPYHILPNKVPEVLFQDGDYLWVANEKGLFKFNKKKQKNYNAKFFATIIKVATKGDSLLFAGNYNGDSAYIQVESSVPVLKFHQNQLTFEYASGFYEQEEKTEFSYRLLGFNDKWSKWTTEHKFTYTNIHEGDFTFQVKARNIYGVESIIASYKFTVLPPWYRTVWAYISYVVFAVLLIWAIVKYNTRRLKQDKERLERIVAERTKEIKEQHDKIAELHKSIMDSIFYARRIQEALLPPDEFLKELLPEYFVLFKPRDIVSGDFYWASHHEGKAILVAADCTGHGVPGAFMSMLGISFLNEIVNKIEHLESHKILNELRANVKKSLRQTGKENEAKDGMDMALCIIDYDNMQMEYSGAFNSLYLIRDGELIKYDADRMPIGIYIREKETFTKHVVQLQKGDAFYIFSDGFVDQFGGPKGSKLMTKRFKQLLLDNYTKPMEEQKTILNNFLEDWQSYTNEKGENYRQIDDILVIGVRV